MMRHATWLVAALMVVVMAAGGCTSLQETLQSAFKTDENRFLSPDKVIVKPEGTPISPIVGNLTPADQSTELPPHAEFPRPSDYVYSDVDYVIGPTDVLEIGVWDLLQQGIETVVRREVTASGFIDLPQVDERIKAEGYTKDELQQVIGEAYSPDILRDPSISVRVLARRQSVFSVLGAVDRPGQYNVTRKDMRLLEALAQAGGITQSSIRYIYVIRQPKPQPESQVRDGAGDGDGLEALPELPEIPEEDGEEPMAPMPEESAEAGEADDAGVADSLRELGEALEGGFEDDTEMPTPAVLPRLSDGGGAAPTGGANGGTAESRWMYSDGEWILVEAPKQEETPTVPQRGGRRQIDTDRTPEDPFGWGKVSKLDMSRVIAVDLERLESGDPRMNIVVRDNDVVHIPPLTIGEFYVMGEVRAPGAYSLTGRRITVKQAIAAAGNLGPLAWPENAVLYRRIGPNQEQAIPIDIEAIFKGEQPDFILKKNDVVAVGTAWQASFYAVMRNAFRMTYGFGFIYDRNFADPLFVTPTSDRFTRL